MRTLIPSLGHFFKKRLKKLIKAFNKEVVKESREALISNLDLNLDSDFEY